MYLIRANRQYVAYTGVIGSARLTGVADVYPGVTGTALFNNISVPDNALTPGDPAYFSSLTGGDGLTTNKTYWVVSQVGNLIQLSESLGGPVFDFTTDITAATLVAQINELYVWSAEYRNQFQTTIRVLAPPANNASPSSEINVPAMLEKLESTFSTISSPVSSTNTAEPTYAELSDEVAGTPLRQDALKRTFWRFNVGAINAPIYVYADFAVGDVISNNPPNTIPTV